ncbi:thioredoxin fold domain-containing protein [Fulvimonas soli]|jgi:hypothetical protein|uniref:Thioredoxin-like protein n=1 Tax=Fulvimonas soli TaxID=155197 RepID=A0A316I2Z7_9GAMM|nr:thioredoxin fold domain-containing protein [Fulvimonas soli]PWK86746.1 thioredoxin-like protein [Fulvimonas soli]
MPPSTWQLAEAAEGVVMGGTPGAKPSIQIIFDANCPYCARLYALLRQEARGIAVRWVPIAYFREDSARLAAAILHAGDPRAALDANFRQYDFHAHHGGYRVPAGATQGLQASNLALQRQWRNWGGYTPMYLVRDSHGATLLTGGAAPDIVRSVLGRAAGPLKSYGGESPTEGRK